ncbi:MAG TPA: dienelactone hydrolase family protein [Candidatus Paceibacterota bacterium]
MKREIKISIDSVALPGTLSVPEAASGIVVFAHGSGSSRFSPRNVFVAEELQKGGIATLLIDLLTEKEDEVYETRFNIDLLTERLEAVVTWIEKEPETRSLPTGLFGASTGAASALRVAARLGERIKAVVSRGGRPDLAMDELGAVRAPTLLIVGGNDLGVIELNEQALAALNCEKKLEIVSGATHLFEEPSALEEVALLASDWFRAHFSAK